MGAVEVNGYTIEPGADLTGANLSEAYRLRGRTSPKAYLSGVTAPRGNLSGVDLTKANLRECALFKAWFKKSDCSGANLQNIKGAQAKMQECILIGAKMAGADLTGTRLEGANLEDASLHTATLTGPFKDTNLIRTDLRGANLRYVVGLTWEQIEDACIDKSTLLPDYLKVKWTSQNTFENMDEGD